VTDAPRLQLRRLRTGTRCAFRLVIQFSIIIMLATSSTRPDMISVTSRHAACTTALSLERKRAQLRQFLSRCWQATDVATPANQNRHQRRIFSGQLPLAGWEMVSTAAIDRADTLMRQSVSATPPCAPGAPPRSRVVAVRRIRPLITVGVSPPSLIERTGGRFHKLQPKRGQLITREGA
jgi:hypothetical protein